ncbi:hypothetical protein TH63_03610 [Rufibacter radiotolerans]|uniref:NADPH-dependent FMN reductase-like domain-containing protein n=1 Tax=Rufibacter radiotolerans TaxID=1379910 RepID=A0A0H4VLX6_9BACT|nr:NAD(P)H-dependent oxidoreductase [Rufibacter radiotolerans]AKQ44917.1 hypothetical protein TH63_03610 [Rufibacter radiotolerans]
MNIVVISGSARPQRRSHQVALEVQRRLSNRQHSCSLLDVKALNLPLLENTLAETANPSAVLKETSASIAACDALVVVSPEHNGSYSGALKNTMDYFYQEYSRKVFGLVAVSSGMLGGVNAARNMQHYALRLHGIVYPEFLLTPKVQTLFTDGQLTDEGYGQRLDKFLDGFLWLAEAIKGAKEQKEK